MSRDYQLFLNDMRECCQKIIKYTLNVDYKGFSSDDMLSDAVIRNLEVIGEAAKNIPDDIRNTLPDVQWRKVAGLRDILIHAYFGISHEILWDIVKVKIPALLTALDKK